MRSTQIDSAHPYSVLVNSSCTGTVLAGAPGKGSFVLTANHCFDNGEYPIISSPDALAGRNPANYSVTVDFSGDLYDDQGDVHTYTPTGVRTSWYEKNGQTRVDMALLYFAPGVPQPFDLFKENTPHHMKLPRAVTSYLDSATPADLVGYVVHVPFNPQTLFTVPSSGSPPHRFDFFGFGSNSYAPNKQQTYRLYAPVAPDALQYDTANGLALPGGVTTARRIVTRPPTSADGYMAGGDSGGGLITTKALSGINFDTLDVNEPFVLSVLETVQDTSDTRPFATHAFLGDELRGPMLEGWMMSFLLDADQDGIPDLQDNCPLSANYVQDDSNLDAERKIYDPNNPDSGHVPRPGEDDYAVQFHQFFPGNNCDGNPVAHLTRTTEIIRVGTAQSCPLYKDTLYGSPSLVSSTAGQCKVQVIGASLAYEGFGPTQGESIPPIKGNVYPSVCMCEPVGVGKADKVGWCDKFANCKVGDDTKFRGASDYSLPLVPGWARIHETNVSGESLTYLT